MLASAIDGGREAVADGNWGELADPDDARSVLNGIARTLARPRGVVPAGITEYGLPAYVQRCHSLMDRLLRIRRANALAY